MCVFCLFVDERERERERRKWKRKTKNNETRQVKTAAVKNSAERDALACKKSAKSSNYL